MTTEYDGFSSKPSESLAGWIRLIVTGKTNITRKIMSKSPLVQSKVRELAEVQIRHKQKI